MERRRALATAIVATSTMAVGTLAYAAAGGATIFVFDAHQSAAASAPAVVVRKIHTLDDVRVVVADATATTSNAPALGAVQLAGLQPLTAAAMLRGEGSPEWRTPTSTSTSESTSGSRVEAVTPTTATHSTHPSTTAPPAPSPVTSTAPKVVPVRPSTSTTATATTPTATTQPDGHADDSKPTRPTSPTTHPCRPSTSDNRAEGCDS